MTIVIEAILDEYIEYPQEHVIGKLGPDGAGDDGGRRDGGVGASWRHFAPRGRHTTAPLPPSGAPKYVLG